MHLKLYKARVVDVGDKNNDMIQVRILPDQLQVPDKEKVNLPWFAPFVQGSVIHCKTEAKDKEKADLVWVVATEGFRFGYVIDKANVTGGISGKGFGGESYNYSEVAKYWQRNNLDSSKIPYEDMKVVFSSFTEDGGVIELYNFRNGNLMILNSSGTCICVAQEGLVLRAGSPDSDFTRITMNSREIKFEGKLFTVSCDDVVLGMNGMKVALIPDGAPPVGVDGISIFPASNING